VVGRVIDILTALSALICLLCLSLGIASERHPWKSTRIISPTVSRETDFSNGHFKLIETRITIAPHVHTTDAYIIIAIYFWPVLVGTLILPFVWLLVAATPGRKPKPGKEGLCRKCGYDLRASKDRCPECGTTTVRESQSS
jgi:hypothetical protein